ncbi:MAG: heavy metal translocating P-type ATPase [Pseudomonadota bacterium]
MPKDQQHTRTTHRYSVANLTCGGCVARAETALAAVPGVTSAYLNLATKQAEVVGDDGFDAQALGAAAAGAGYPITPLDVETLRLSIANLTCGGCAARAEAALLAHPDVVTASVNLALHRAEVTLRAGAGLADIQAAMDAAGYPVALIDSARAPRPEVEDDTAQTRRAMLWAAALTLPVFVMEMGGHLFPAFHHWQMVAAGGTFPLHLIQFVLATAVLAGPGRVFFRLGVPALLRGKPEMNSLVVLGTSAAWAWSTVVTFAPDLVPATGRFVYFEAAAVIVTLILLGRWLEARARGQAGAAIAGLMALRPETAVRVGDAGDVEVPLADLRVGDHIRLRPGDRVAVDGVVVDGHSFVDEAMISGEPVPVEKAAGDDLTGGTVNGTGGLIYRATAVGADTVLARIVAMVEDAQATRLPVQSLINRVTAVFVPVVLAIALVASALWLAFGPDPAKALVIGVSVLIIACPCAMGLATPVSILAGTGRAAELGVLFRRGEALQELGKVDLVAFDKTGTLTEGRPSVVEIVPADGISEEDLLALAAGAEVGSEHPLASAIVETAETRGLTPAEVSGFESRTGAGVMAQHDGGSLVIGTAAFLEAAGVSVPVPPDGAMTLVHVALDGRYLGYLALADALKPDAIRAVASLHAQGKTVAILSGDAEGPVQAVAAELGVDLAFARLSPEQKVEQVKEWRRQKRRVAFVGDGINDAAVLAAADVGIALGTGTDIAIEAGDVVLVSGAPSGVATAIEVSRRTLRNIVQNLVWAFGYNVALIPVAAGLLALFGGPFLNPMLAAGAMALSSVLVVMNALRLGRMEAV